MMIRIRALLVVAVSCLSAACSGLPPESPAKVYSELRQVAARSADGPDAMKVVVIRSSPSVDRQRCAALFARRESLEELAHCSGALWDRDPKTFYSDVAALHAETALIAQPGFRVFDSPSFAEYELKVVVAEVVDDVEKAKSKQKDALHTVGFWGQMSLPYISIAAVPYVAPAAGILQAFDLLTGIPVSWDNKSTVGSVRVDIALTRRATGEVIEALSSPGTFRSEIRQIGGDHGIGPGKTVFRSSTKEDAIRVAVAAGIEQLSKKLSAAR